MASGLNGSPKKVEFKKAILLETKFITIASVQSPFYNKWFQVPQMMSPLEVVNVMLYFNKDGSLPIRRKYDTILRWNIALFSEKL